MFEYSGEVITWAEALARHPHDPAQPDHTFYFHIDDQHVIDGNVGGNASRWINHACRPNCEADEDGGRVFIRALRADRRRRGAVLRLRADARRPPHGEGEEAVRMPLRQTRPAAARCWRRSADRRGAPTIDPDAHDPCPCRRIADRGRTAAPALGRRVAVGAARAAAAGAERRGGGAHGVDQLRADRARPAGAARRGRAASASSTSRAAASDGATADTQPCLLVAEQQIGGRGRIGRAWRSAPGASLTFSLALPLAPADWSGLSLAVGVALAEALQPGPRAEGRPWLAVKWPNDLWLVDARRRRRGAAAPAASSAAC